MFSLGNIGFGMYIWHWEGGGKKKKRLDDKMQPEFKLWNGALNSIVPPTGSNLRLCISFPEWKLCPFKNTLSMFNLQIGVFLKNKKKPEVYMVCVYVCILLYKGSKL